MDIYQILHLPRNVSPGELQRKYEKTVTAYRITATFASDAEVRAIGQRKLEQLLRAGEQAGLRELSDDDLPEGTPQYSLQQVKLALSSTQSEAKNLLPLGASIDALPESAEKHYLKSLWHLRTDTGSDLTHLNAAASEIQQALRLEPDHPTYTAVLAAIQEAIQRYQQRQEDLRRQAEEEKRAAEQRREEEQRRIQRQETARTAGSCVCTLIAIPFVCLGECCDGC